MKKLILLTSLILLNALYTFGRSNNHGFIHFYKDGSVFKTIPLEIINEIEYYEFGDEFYQSISYSDYTDSYSTNDIDSILFNVKKVDFEKDYEEYSKIIDNLRIELKSGIIKDCADFAAHAQAYSSVIATELESGGCRIYFRGGLSSFYDYGNITSPIKSEADFSKGEDLLNEIVNILSDNDEQKNIKGRRLPHFAETDDAVIPLFKILYWCPWEGWESNESAVFDSVCNRINAEGEKLIEFTSITGTQCTSFSMKNFDKYDLVIFATHGINGNIVFPEHLGTQIPESEKCISKSGKVLYIPNYQELISYLPSDLSKTIVWTLQCYGNIENSHTKKLFAGINVADFFGATEIIETGTVESLIFPYLTALYMGATSFDAFKNAANAWSDFWYPYECQSSEGISISGWYGHSADKAIWFPYNYVRKPLEDKYPTVVFQGSDDCFRYNIFDNELELGIYYENLTSGKQIYEKINEKNIIDKTEKDFRDIVHAWKFSLNSENLAPGNYRYRSYVKTSDGEIALSRKFETLRIAESPINHIRIKFRAPHEAYQFYLNRVLIEGSKVIEVKGAALYYDQGHEYVILDDAGEIEITYSGKAHIGRGAFGNHDKNTLPVEEFECDGVIESVGPYGFLQCPLTLYKCKETKEIYYFAFEDNDLETLDIEGLEKIDTSAISFCDKLKTINLNGSFNIEGSIIDHCDALERVELMGDITATDNDLYYFLMSLPNWESYRLGKECSVCNAVPHISTPNLYVPKNIFNQIQKMEENSPSDYPFYGNGHRKFCPHYKSHLFSL